MANSTVTFTQIDEEYPVAGQDNDSQGFRDNFSTIKTGMQNASTELGDLLTNSARKDVSNDFNGNLIVNASSQAVSEKVYNTGSLVNTTVIEWSDGSFQNVTVSNSLSLELDGWPTTGNYGKMTLALRGQPGAEITFQPPGTGVIKVTPTNWPQVAGNNAQVLEMTSITDPVLVEAWTSDAGQSVHLNYLGLYSTL